VPSRLSSGRRAWAASSRPQGDRFPQANSELRSNSTLPLHEKLRKGHLDLVFTANELAQRGGPEPQGGFARQ